MTSVHANGRGLRGPQCPTTADIPALNRLFSDAFTDRYRKDGLTGAQVPQLKPIIWQYALRDADDGAMVWFDDRGQLVAFNIAHQSGVEGWMGPLAVRADRQSSGIGRMIVLTAIDWLRSRGARAVGLETMPRTVDNIGFYSGLGFLPGHLTVTMTVDCERKKVRGSPVCLGDLPEETRRELWQRCRARLEQSAPGYDYTREFDLTLELAIGDVVVLERDGVVTGFAVWHSVPLTDGRPSDELRVLKVFADSAHTFDRLVTAIEQCAVDLGILRVSIRCQTAYADAYGSLLRRRYRVRWTDLRMTLRDHPETKLAGEEVLFSNWEI